MLIDNPLYFTIQTSPPEEPDELFHKELPVKRCRPALDGCDTQNLDRFPLPCFANDDSICDIDGNRCEVSTLTKSLSWLKLNARKEISRLRLFNVSSPSGDATADSDPEHLESCNSSLEMTNPNSAVLSDTNLSVSLADTVSSRPSLKRKLAADNLTYVISAGAETAVPDTVEKMKSKRRCVVFNEQSFTLNTPPLSEDGSRRSSGVASVDLDKPSTLRRQKVIRRKNKRRSLATVPQTIYNKNLNSWLTLPNGIPSPFEVDETHFKILSRTPMTTRDRSNGLCGNDTSTFSVLKKAVSTPKPGCPFDLTEDVFLSPGVPPLLDSVMTQSSSDTNVVLAESKPQQPDEPEETSFMSPVSEVTWNSHGKHLRAANSTRDNDGGSSTADSTQSGNSSRINDDQDVFSSIGK